MSNTTEIKVPDIGDFENVEIIDVLVKAGDVVRVRVTEIDIPRKRIGLKDRPAQGERPERKGIMAALLNRDCPGVDPDPRSAILSLDRDVEALLASVRHSRQDAEALRAQREALTNELAQARRRSRADADGRAHGRGPMRRR